MFKFLSCALHGCWLFKVIFLYVRSCNIITCTTKGVVLILSLKDDGTYKVKNRWELSFSPKFCQMDTTEDYFAFGGWVLMLSKLLSLITTSKTFENWLIWFCIRSTNELRVWKVEEFLWKLSDVSSLSHYLSLKLTNMCTTWNTHIYALFGKKCYLTYIGLYNFSRLEAV